MEDSIEDYIRIQRNIKAETQISKEVLITAQIKKQCDSKAMQIVHFAIEGKLRTEALFRCLPFITKEHYQDIIEERAITKLCGYPLCGKTIPEMPKKQFHIATKSNKVYDITERKNYCSNYCYKASIHIQHQIDNSPLWLRKYDKIPQYTLLNKSEKGIPGQLVDQGVIRSSVDHHSFTSINDFAQFSLDEAEENEISAEEEEKSRKPARKPKKYQKVSMNTINENEEDEEEEEKVDLAGKSDIQAEIQVLTEKNVAKHDENDIRKITPTRAKPSTSSPQIIIDVEKQISKCFAEWITLESFIFIHGENVVKEKLDDAKLCEYFDSLKIAELEIEQQKKYLDICRKLHRREMAEEKFDRSIVGHSVLGPIPDYHELKNEIKQMDLRVKSFFSGEIQVRTKSEVASTTKEDVNDMSGGDSQPVVLPMTEASSQTALRRKIFLTSLNKAMQSLLISLKVGQHLVLPDLKLLARTFRLKADNIVFKPNVWNMITIILLKMLCLKNVEIKNAIPENRFEDITKLWFASISNYKEFIERTLNLVRDLDSFVPNYIKSSNQCN